jgi:hypothetical protein
LRQQYKLGKDGKKKKIKEKKTIFPSSNILISPSSFLYFTKQVEK